MRGFWEIFFGIFPDEDGSPLADWGMKSPNSVHKHTIFVQDFPESLIANEHLNRAIHDAVGQMPLESPVLGVAVNFRMRQHIRGTLAKTSVYLPNVPVSTLRAILLRHLEFLQEARGIAIQDSPSLELHGPRVAGRAMSGCQKNMTQI